MPIAGSIYNGIMPRRPRRRRISRNKNAHDVLTRQLLSFSPTK